ncbi:MAG: T9SS type A sorting domain-containing protein, partial [Lentimicrobium sp.]|nr:T9SS type A sorting domain-containing protein [Lentimicrobium sp.]
EVSDTVTFCILPDVYGDPYQIDHIGEGLVFGLNTRLFFVDGFNDLGYYYEGIGSDYGLFENMFIPVKNTNYNLYGTSLGYYCRNTPCGLIVSTNDQPLPFDFSVYPNPANGEIYVQLPTNIPPSATKVEVYGADGRLVYKAIPGHNPFVFNARNLMNGLYLIRVWDGKVWLSGKVVKE